MFLKLPNWLVILDLILYQAIAARTALSFSNETDHQALLTFKTQIISDPFKSPSSWNDSIHFCYWRGVNCRKKHQWVTALNLTSLQLVDHLSPHIGNLTVLWILNLDANASLELYTTRNRLLDMATNSFSSKLFSWWRIAWKSDQLVELLILNLSGNNLSGRILNGLSSMLKLTRLGLSANHLSGEIPASLGNLSTLTHIYLADNHIKGSLPLELGSLSNLLFLQLSIDNLSGHIPISLFNISSIEFFFVAFNNLSGSLNITKTPRVLYWW